MSKDSLNKITTEVKCEVEKLHKTYDLFKAQLKQEYSEGKIDKRIYYNNILAIGNMIKHDNRNLIGCSQSQVGLKRKSYILHNFQQIEFELQGLLVDIMKRHQLILNRMKSPGKMTIQVPSINHH
jgi:hypothetical protein